MSPTRELASQIVKEANKLLQPYRTQCVLVVGGEDRRKQLKAITMNRNSQVVVATPGRLVDLLESHETLNKMVKKAKVVCFLKLHLPLFRFLK
jgi:superfamily II DNA/RNA helicase